MYSGFHLTKILLFCSTFIMAISFIPLFACADEVKSVDRPVFENSAAPTFTFTYRILNQRVGAPTVVFFQGGPGGPVLDSMPPDIFPKDYQVLLFDPRGTGRSQINDSFKYDSNSSSSVQIAKDVLAAIQAENIHNYIVWANSYGTVPATILSHLVSNKQDSKPRLVILEGTIGRAFRLNTKDQLHESVTGYKHVLERAIDALDSDEKTKIRAKVDRLQLQSDILSEMFLNITSNGIDSTVTFLRRFLAESDDSTQNKIQSFMLGRKAYESMPAGIDFKNQMKIIACSEILDLKNTLLKHFISPILNGTIQFANLYPECIDAPSKNNLYSSAAYQISEEIPILYVVAKDDPNTPRFQTNAHFSGQKTKHHLTQIVLTSTGGHFPLQFGPLSNCRNQFWDSMREHKSEAAIIALRHCAD